MTFGSTFGRVFSPTFKPNSQTSAVSTPWYLSGGIAAVNCVAAYQPKGAASLAASYVNLAYPGTYDLTLSGVAPDLVANGWKQIVSQLTTLDTGITPTDYNWSIISLFITGSDGQKGCQAGYTTAFGIYPVDNSISTRLYAGSTTSVYTFSRGTDTKYCLGISDRQGYLDGSAVGTKGTGTTNPTGTLKFLNINSARQPNVFCASAIYNTSITAAQVAAVSAAMIAL